MDSDDSDDIRDDPISHGLEILFTPGGGSSEQGLRCVMDLTLKKDQEDYLIRAFAIRKVELARSLLGRKNKRRYSKWLKWRDWLIDEKGHEDALEVEAKEREWYKVLQAERDEKDAIKTLANDNAAGQEQSNRYNDK